MSTLVEIETAAEALAASEKRQLIRFLEECLSTSEGPPRRARVVRQGNDVLLEAPPGAPLMTAENVKGMLEDWP